MQGPIVSSARVGRILIGSIFAAGIPQLPGGAANIGPSYWPGDPLWIPPGVRMLIQAGTLDVDMSVAHTVQELPADTTDH
jgi:hypothetical protein